VSADMSLVKMRLRYVGDATNISVLNVGLAGVKKHPLILEVSRDKEG